MRYSNKYDWETREDANILQQYQEIIKNPERLKKAQSCIKESVKDLNKALGVPVSPAVPGRSNPATIMKLKP